MEKLQRRSDGIAETPSGLFAISPRRVSGQEGENRYFDFRRSAVSEVIRVRWPVDDTIAVIKAGTALFMLERRYASTISDEEMRLWNERIDELDLDATDPEPSMIPDDREPEVIEEKAEPAHEPTSGQTPAPATTAPAAAKTAPEGQDLAKEGTGEGQQPPAAAQGSEGEGDAEKLAEGTDGDGTTETAEEGSEGAKPKGKVKKAEKGLL